VNLAPQRRRLHEINVTPLVDVFLVLLVIFMITAPALRSALEVGLPEAVAGGTRADASLLVELRSDGGLWLGTRALAPAELPGVLRAEALRLSGGDSAAAARRTVFVAADRRTPYGDVVALLDRLRQAGFADAGLLTDPPLPEAPRNRRR
jgi:biopolymer transport protein TolR